MTRPYPDLLSDEESKALLSRAKEAWRALQGNDLGGFSGGNRPFWLLHEFKTVIEEFGRRDVGLKWSKDDLDKAARPEHPDFGMSGGYPFTADFSETMETGKVTLRGPPVPREFQMLFGRPEEGPVTGVVAIGSEITVAYASGLEVKLIPSSEMRPGR